MTAGESYLLDTGVVLHYSRKSPVYETIENRYQLTKSRFRPMVCVVSLGEIRAIAYRRNWGDKRRGELDAFLSSLVGIDISDGKIIEAYARISAHATANGWALHSQKNDLWIAATAHVTGATLLTTDKDFTEAHGVFIKRVLFDNVSGTLL